eukprot:1043175-Rhodomonas_salina.1
MERERKKTERESARERKRERERDRRKSNPVRIDCALHHWEIALLANRDAASRNGGSDAVNGSKAAIYGGRPATAKRTLAMRCEPMRLPHAMSAKQQPAHSP